MDAFEGDFSFCVAGVSTIIIGSFDCGWGLLVFIRMLLLALKFMEGSLFRCPFCFGDMLRVASTAAASLAKISGDISFCCSVSMLPVESLVLTVFWLPVETVFTISIYLATGVFSFNFVVVALGVPSPAWTFSVLSTLICNRFSLGICAFIPPTVLGSSAWPFSCFSSCFFCAASHSPPRFLLTSSPSNNDKPL